MEAKMPTPDFDAEVARLAALSELEFERCHKAEAKSLGVLPGTLKRVIREARKQAERQYKDSLKRAVRIAEVAAAATHAQPNADNLPVIQVSGGSRHTSVDAALEAMRRAGVPFYVRGTELVRPCIVDVKSADNRTVRVPSLVRVTKPMMGRAMGQTAHWQKSNLDGTLRTIDPPVDVVEQAIDMVGEWPFDAVAGVLSTPTLRPDGSLLATEGYDQETGLILLELPPMPAISDAPTRQDAEAALQLLLDLLYEFPFADSVSQSVGLSMLLTPVLRGGLPPAVPLHIATAPEAGTGKSFLADIASIIATGDRCYVQSAASGDPKETEKRLVGAALAGHPIIALDNCNGGEGLSGDFLCQLTERPALQLRRLGGSDMFRGSNSFTVLASGNNVSLFADMVRRSLVAELDANMESPENRSFTGDPIAAVLADRGRYIAACLTIARAYIVAGKPGRLTPLPSYGGWSDTVRSALVWLGQADPVLSQSALRVEDPVRLVASAVFDAWESELGLNSSGYLTADLIKEAERGWSDGKEFLVHPRLHEALLDVAQERPGDQRINAKRLGRWLAKAKKQVRHGLKLTADTSNPSRTRWVLTRSE